MQEKNQWLSELERLFRQYGDQHYGEHCTQYEHMAQCGWWADQKGYDEDLVIAAFLHDLGHLLAEAQNLPGRDQWGYARHDVLAEAWLRDRGFPDSVCVPIGQHVQAKRYLVSAREGYADKMSTASQATLTQQGGPFNEQECRAFEAQPYFEQTLKLRELDELGKAEQFELPALEVWLTRLNRFATKENSHA